MREFADLRDSKHRDVLGSRDARATSDMGTCCSCLPLGRVTKQDASHEKRQIELETIREEEDETASLVERYCQYISIYLSQ